MYKIDFQPFITNENRNRLDKGRFFRTIVRFFVILPQKQKKMEHIKGTKEYILYRAYEQYLLHGYHNVSISILQQELQIGRASLYYYFKDKDSLFAAILNKFILSHIEASTHTPTTIGINDLIDCRVKCIDAIANHIQQLHNPTLSIANVASLMLSGITQLQDFMLQLKDLEQIQFSQWKTAIQNSINRGEIKADCDVTLTAYLFQHLKCGYEDPYCDLTNNVSDFYLKSCHHLLNLIRNK